VTALCSQGTIKVLGSEVSIETTSFTIVLMDLIIILVFWIALICVKPMIDAAAN
jgi:hypothetical protein